MIRPQTGSSAPSSHFTGHSSLLESLEARCLMSANLLGTTTLRIVGDADAENLNDTIIIDVDPADESQLRVTVNGELLASRAIKRMKAITISAGQGDDTVQINVPGLRCGVTIHGGDGDDDITGSAKGDRIFAGAGDDTVNAGTGGDLVYGGQGDDHLDGQAGADKLYGDAGDDSLLGASGRDLLVGGLGADDIYGRPRYDRIRLDDADTLTETQQANPLEQGDLDADLRARLIDLAVEQYRYLLGTTQYYYWHWWSRDYGLPQVGLPGGGVVITAASPGDSPSNAPGGFDPTDHSNTNNQVTGVEEADIVKTDGSFIYTFDSGDLLTINANPDELAVMSRLAIEGYGQEMYLHGDRVTVISTIWDWIIDDPRPLPEKGDTPGIEPGFEPGVEGDMLLARPAVGMSIWMPRHRSDPRVKVTVIDVADRENPLVVEETYIDGSLTSSRSVGDDVYLVVQNDVSLPAPLYTDDGEGKTYTYETEDEYRARLEAMDIESFLPQVRTAGGEGEAGADDDITNSLLNPDNFHVPVLIENDNLISIAKINVADEFTGVDDSATTFGLAGVVYASADALYIAATNYDHAWDATGGVSTDIYKFNLGDDLAYAAGGSVKGAAFNQFALDEYDGTFRIVTRNWSWTERSSTSLFVLEQSGDELTTIGGLTGIGKLESLQSVRFMGDRAFIVTFLQVDPLFAIDLSNPIKPKLRGELTIPGFSSYLHPIDANHLIGIGQGARPGTLKLSLFDVTDLNNPLETDNYTFDEDAGWSGSIAQWDHKAFSYFPAQGILALPLNAWNWNPTTGSENTSALAVLEVDPATGFTRLSDVEHETPVQRSLRIGGLLYSLSLDTLKVNELVSPENLIAELIFTDP